MSDSWPDKFLRGSISTRFALLFSLLILLATSVVGWMVYNGARRSLIDAATDRLAQTVEVLDVRLAASVEAISKDALFLAATPPVAGIVRVRTCDYCRVDPETNIFDDEWRDQLADLFTVFLQNKPTYYAASFAEIKNGGQELVRVEKRDGAATRVPTGSLGPTDDAAFFADVVTQPPGTVMLSEIEPADDDAGAEPASIMRAALPVYTADSTAYGAIFVYVKFTEMANTLLGLIDPDKTLIIANQDGRPLLHAGPLASRLPFDGKEGLQAVFPQVVPLFDGRATYTRIESATYGDTPASAFFQRINLRHGGRQRTLILGVLSPHSVILEDVRQVRDRSLIITLLFSLGGIILALGLSGLLTRPLSLVIQAVSRFGQEDWRRDLQLQRQDEIGLLSRTFDTMATQIETQLSELEDKEHRQRTILETSAEGIIVTDNQGLIETFNTAAERIFGYDADDVIGQNVRMLVAGDEHPDVPSNGQFSFPEGQPLGTGREFLGRRADGSTVPLSIAASAFIFGGEQKYASFFQDITERKQYEEALEHAKEEAEDMARLKSAFLANMSHEIRTPLTSIIGYASALAKEVKDKHLRFVQLIESSGKRLMDTLNAVLALAQLEAQKVRVEMDVIDVPKEVGEIVQMFEQQAEKKGLDLGFRVSPGAKHAQASLDRGALSSILQNLIGNAIKFTKTGGVTVQVDTADEQVLIKVADTGVGMNEAFLPHIFDEFRQESTGISRSHEGTGLGLSITKRLVELLSGTIGVDSQKDRGSTFTIAFPLVEAPSPPQPAPEGPAVPEEGFEAHVLLVEDNPDTAFLVLHLLLDLCTVTLATNAKEAIQKARKQAFDLLLLDINLGGDETGIDVLNEIRSLPEGAAVPAVALTAYALPGDRERFLQAGFDDYLAKPFTADELLALTTQLLLR